MAVIKAVSSKAGIGHAIDYVTKKEKTEEKLAVYLTFRRSPYFALAYAANDIVLIILWILASLYDIRYVSVVVCFIAFFANDIYGFVSWRKMKTRQQEITNVVSIM